MKEKYREMLLKDISLRKEAAKLFGVGTASIQRWCREEKYRYKLEEYGSKILFRKLFKVPIKELYDIN